MEVTDVAVADLIPYAKNARTHSAAQVAQIAASIQHFGFTNPLLIDESLQVIAGHGRLAAASSIGLQSVPCIVLEGLSEAQRRALVIADNKLAENATWDAELLAVELSDLKALDFDLGLIGFGAAELASLLDPDDDRYTRKFAAPDYEPSQVKPELSELCDNSKAVKLAAEIRAANVSEAEKRFLLLAAERHAVFNFRKVADYYAHASAEMQELMERSALVIIDLDKAIINGYVLVGEKIMAQYAEDAGVDA